jgi:2-polyprenyl-6-hydroxyphenyl methylase/3-demethylubiquinone-9 3-methyltransferase
MQLRWQIAQFFEIRWWRRYLSGKDKSAYLAQKRRYWVGILGQLRQPPAPGERVLDAGCGPAGIFIALPGQQVDALDPLLPAYTAQLPHFSPEDYPNVRFLPLPLENFSPERPYDTVFCLNAINHVADLPRSLDRLVASARAGGRLVLSVDAHRHRWLQRIFQWLPGDILHPHQYGLTDYADMLRTRGCVVEQTLRLKKGLVFDYFLLETSTPGA